MKTILYIQPLIIYYRLPFIKQLAKNLQYLKKKYSNLNWVVWYGEIYDESKIKKISKNCRIGAYLGYSGLNIVHYLALSLPVLLKKSLIEHEEPENYYCNKNNSFRANIETINQIEKKISYVWSLSNYILEKYGKCGFDTYLKISNRDILITFIQKILNFFFAISICKVIAGELFSNYTFLQIKIFLHYK